MSQVSVLANLRIVGALQFDKDFDEFPANPKIGTLIIKDRCLYGYLKIGEYETWYPFARNTNFYFHVQALPQMRWTINHNLNTTEIWYQIKDEQGNVISPASFKFVDENTLVVDFSEPTTGTIILVGTAEMSVPAMTTSRINVGSTVVIDTAGMTIEGERVLTRATVHVGDGTSEVFAVDQHDRLDFVGGQGIDIDYDAVNKRLVFTAPSMEVTPAYVESRIQAVIGNAPALLDTLNEISAAINNDPNLYQTIVTLVNNKATETREYADQKVADEAVARGIAVDAVSSKIGSLPSLSTAAKSNIVAAVNELKTGQTDEAAARQSADSALGERIDDAVQANADEAVARQTADTALGNKIGDLAGLTTETKVSVVAAVNEVREDLGEHVNNASVHVSAVEKAFLALVQQSGSDFVIDCN